jgi:hypothetical protein
MSSSGMQRPVGFVKFEVLEECVASIFMVSTKYTRRHIPEDREVCNECS